MVVDDQDSRSHTSHIGRCAGRLKASF
jgi:hypothetical protein